jgi:hypothetical protein
MGGLSARRALGLSSLALVWAYAVAGRADPVFVDATLAAGVDYLQHAPETAPDCIFGFCETDRMTGGAAVADVDGDGDLDLFVTRLDAHDLLFRNDGNGSFTDVSLSAGFSAWVLQSNGPVFGDIDNDGDPDLFVTTLGTGSAPNDRDYLFLNDGTGSFTEAAVARGAAGVDTDPRVGFSATFGDYDRDGWLDLHTTEWTSSGTVHMRLLHNLGPTSPGFFSDTTASAGVALVGVFGFASSFTDLDGDSWPDLAIAADFGTSRLFWNDGDGTFTNGTTAAGVGTDENGMGSTFGDYDGDGDLDWFVTAIHDASGSCPNLSCGWGDTGNRLYRYDGARVFSDQTDAKGVREGHWGWGSAFFDYDNDGDLDLVMTNGVIFPDSSTEDHFNGDPIRFWRNDGAGVMTEVSLSAGLTDTRSGAGLLVFDYDEDGDLDLFVVNNGDSPVLYRNDGGNANSWLRVRANGGASNRDGIGVIVRVRASAAGAVQLHEIGSTTHFLGQSERIAHFGLGPAAGPVHEVELEWPSGATTLLTNVPANQLLVVQEAAITPAVPVWAVLVGGGGVALAALGRLRSRRAGDAR